MTALAPVPVSSIGAALEALWTRIRELHPDVPDAVIVLGAATVRARAETQGHFAAARWVDAGDTRRAEVMIAAELLRNHDDVLEVLLHEAAHGIAHAKGVEDTSRQGRWHNKRYRALALEVGLEVAKTEKWGWSETRLPATTRARYLAQLEALDAAHTAAGRVRRVRRGPRLSPPSEPGEGEVEAGEGEAGEVEAGEGEAEGKSGRRVALVCDCDPIRRIWISAGSVDRAPVICGGCGSHFTPAG